jgi:uncharacterized paraquat-inducible protein A
MRIMLLRIKTFIKSLFFHVLSGFPKTTHEEIYQRYSVCESCEEFNKQKNQCNICGCNITKKSQFLNKLAWADQECPLGKWNKIFRTKK